MIQKQKKFVVIGVVIFLLLIAGFWLLAGRKQKQITDNELFPTEMVIPTIDDSVTVELESNNAKQEVTLTIKNLPDGTESIEYELAYNTSGQGLQGVNSTIEIDSGESNYEKVITLGTCSSGKCVYHQVLGKIKLSLKFNGKYGEKVYEKEYEI